MKRQYTDIDTGYTVVSISLEYGKNGRPIITAFSNGLSTRCGSVHLQRSVALFAKATVVLANYPDPQGRDKDKAEQLERDIIAYAYAVTEKPAPTEDTQ
jgi:hypothetical protein